MKQQQHMLALLLQCLALQREAMELQEKLWKGQQTLDALQGEINKKFAEQLSLLAKNPPLPKTYEAN